MKMQKRDVVRLAIQGKKVPYVPWSLGFTEEAREKLEKHYGKSELDSVLDDHFVGLGNGIGFFDDIGDDCVRDVFGVTWDRSRDKDIGIVKGLVLPEPTFKHYQFPDALDKRFFAVDSSCDDLVAPAPV